MIARYLDTSLLVSFYVQEAQTVEAQNWLAGIGNSPLVISLWVIVEFSSALAIKVRRGELTQTDLALAEQGFNDFATSRPRCLEILPVDYHRASLLCRNWQLGLRAGDALHLALAERHGLTVCTLDRGMIHAADALKIPIETIIP